MPRGKAGTDGVTPFQDIVERAKKALELNTKSGKKPRAQKGHKLPEQFASGEVLQDVFKKRWVIGEVIGQGGFGLIYLASKEDDVKKGPAAEYVIKIEPIGNGPLFCETHFYQRVAKSDMVDSWLKSKKLKYLGVPKYICSGQHMYKGTNYRFLVMQRFGTDLQKLFENNKKSFTKQTVYALALRMIDALEYLHENSYIHADIKASNCLLGFKNGKMDTDTVYLVDFGLATKYEIDGKHKEYKEDPKKAHDGTIEFTSRDSHNGVAPSRRGDMEILGYCLLQWLCGTLPWEDKLTDKNYVRDQKIRYMGDISALMKKCFPGGSIPEEITAYLTAVKNLKYEEKPNYTKYRDIFTKGLSKLGVKDTWKLALPLPGARVRSPSPKKSAKTPAKSTDSPRSKSGVKTKPGRPGTPQSVTKPATPGSAASPKPGPSTPIPGKPKDKKVASASKKPTTPKDNKKPVKRATTPKGAKTTTATNSIIPGLKTVRAGSAKIPGKIMSQKSKVTARNARSPVSSSPLTNGVGKRDNSPGGSPAPKKRKVIRKRNAHLVETSCQTSPGLKKNR